MSAAFHPNAKSVNCVIFLSCLVLSVARSLCERRQETRLMDFFLFSFFFFFFACVRKIEGLCNGRCMLHRNLKSRHVYHLKRFVDSSAVVRLKRVKESFNHLPSNGWDLLFLPSYVCWWQKMRIKVKHRHLKTNNLERETEREAERQTERE